LNGGPGASSLFGMFLENGPLRITHTIDNFQVSYTNETWADAGSLLYIDNPIGSGFSYGKDYVKSMDEASEELLDFLLNFYIAYPEFAGRPLFLTGESYAGKFLPNFAKSILDFNLNNCTSGQPKINLSAILVADPYVDPIVERLE
jgi:carboxypeptidase C (cathepsin A)